MAYEDAIRTTLRTAWHQAPDTCAQLHDGMNSRTWDITVGDRRYVAKLVPPDQRQQFEAGLCAAAHLARSGIATGAPVRTVDGALTAVLEGGVLGLLRHVPGRPLDGPDPLDQQWWGDLLGMVHRALDGFAHPGLTRWHWLRPDAPHLGLADWLRPAVAEAVAAMTKLCVTDQLTYGVLHGDPAPVAFRMDPATGRTGLIDWGVAGTGPLVYDVASAVMYAGGPAAAADLLDGYAAAGPVSRDEIDAALPSMLRFRWAVQADHFACRIACGEAAESDRAGLRQARDALTA